MNTQASARLELLQADATLLTRSSRPLDSPNSREAYRGATVALPREAQRPGALARGLRLRR